MTYALLPLIETLDEMGCTVRVFMVNGKEFEKNIKLNPICFTIIPRGLSCSSDDQVTKASVN